jgi:hypothetical protein
MQKVRLGYRSFPWIYSVFRIEKQTYSTGFIHASVFENIFFFTRKYTCSRINLLYF